MAQIRLSSIGAALEQCAPGHTRVQTLHHCRIVNEGKAYFNFPRGAHGAIDPEIEAGHIRTMARALGVLDCMKSHLP